MNNSKINRILSSQEEQEGEKLSPVAKRMAEGDRLTKELYRHMGVDVDHPMDKTVHLVNWEEKNRQHEEFHRIASQFKASAK